MNPLKLNVFYDDFAESCRAPFIFKVVVSLSLGCFFILPHYFLSADLFESNSFFLAAIISFAMASLYIATQTLRNILPEMEKRTIGDGNLFMAPLNQLLATNKFIQYGFGFALLNCLLAFIFGIPQESEYAHPQYIGYVATLYFGYFLSGFVCGMAVLGIIAVSKSLRKFGLLARRSLDFTSPDKCGGTLFIGNALVIFGSVTLFVGILISAYIIKTNWVNENSLASELKLIWIIFPYFISTVVFISPSLTLNKSLLRYKRQQGYLLKNRSEELRRQLDSEVTLENSDLVKRYEFNQKIRGQLHQMRTWPYGLSANIKYLSVVATNTAFGFLEVKNEIESVFKNLF